MKASWYTAALASACMIGAVVASPILVLPRADINEEQPPVRRTETDSGIASDVKRDTLILDPLKYFHEPGTDDILGHYDVRFFHGIVSYEERTDTLSHMIRAYLQFFREKGLETWIAHGTLLGWWWNGKMLPWDWDIDTQVSDTTLAYLGTHLNQTLHEYNVGDTQRRCLLDVNPFSSERVRGDGMNIIDARWIDVRNGLYIDITGLSETQPEAPAGVWSCKNEHHYGVKDLYPMRESIYEGVPALIPYAYEKILTEEYHAKALVVQEYQGHEWDQTKKEWIPKTELKRDDHSAPEPRNNMRKRHALRP